MADVDRATLDPPPPYSEAVATTPKTQGGALPSVSQSQAAAPTPNKKSLWKRPVMIPIVLLGVGVIVGVIVGTVVGAKRVNASNASSSRLQSGVTSSYPYYYYPSTTTTYISSSTYYYDYPTESPNPEPRPMLNNQSIIPRTFGGASESPFGLTAWDLKEDGTLWIEESRQGEWIKVLDQKFLLAPIAVKTGDGTQMAVSVDAITGQIVVAYFRDVSRGNGGIDIFAIDSMGEMWTVSQDNGFWSEFEYLGSEFTGEVSATSWDEKRIDVFARRNTWIYHLWWTNEGGWSNLWEELGEAYVIEDTDFSPPRAVSWRSPEGDGIIDVVVNSGSTYHKMFSNGAWGNDWDIVPASHEGGVLPHTISVVSGDGVDERPFAHMMARGDDNCIHYISHNGTEWDSWVPLWCGENGVDREIISHMATSIIRGEDGVVDCIVRDYSGDLMRYQVKGHLDPEGLPPFNDDWEILGAGG
ncbi:hypothetical protein BU24DRAFT_467636 [Aaosphaeria arxii CBS 175.79]|uniref:Fucose-specific lectin n=1 Tax=Aaosphaeria arxii CBS 175.79 TaxID=1450172 RepID=A0A6A5XB78_9PLEO|nr:uncharacterized protein BU24DRAFT_467636 [Aaosphaeria arxii CBS 175.79]KAF2010159.1 hypothetical protein BU24DRAFT_467636 [Aaosphaeria arxii CBS 175.79]